MRGVLASRITTAVYAGIAVVLVLLGVGAVTGSPPPDEAEGGGVTTLADGPRDDGGGGAGAVVHVAGAVHEPGVYELPFGARVADAIKRAGGPTGRAEVDGINLAARLSDGQQVVVPARAPSGGTAAVAGAGAGEGPISLGTASAADLEGIDGIGPVTAEKIIAFRDERGGVRSVEELDEIPGIGPATIETLSAGLQP